MGCLSGLPAAAGWYGKKVIFGVVKNNKGASEVISSDAPFLVMERMVVRHIMHAGGGKFQRWLGRT